MRKLDFTKATLSQLYEIACNDPEAGMYKQEAAEEIVRRQKKKRKPYPNLQQKIRTVAAKW